MSNMKILAIVGSRNFPDLRLVKDYVKDVYALNNSHGAIKRIVSGGARGVDSLAEKTARAFNFYEKTFVANWAKYGKQAGYIRNKEMIEYADEVAAFWDGESPGTKHSIDLALKLRKSLIIFVRFHSKGEKT